MTTSEGGVLRTHHQPTSIRPDSALPTAGFEDGSGAMIKRAGCGLQHARRCELPLTHFYSLQPEVARAGARLVPQRAASSCPSPLTCLAVMC